MHPSHPPLTHSKPELRILIVRLSAHGDVIHALPLLSALKKQHPQARVGWLVENSAAPLLENHPLIDELHVSHRKRWLQELKNPLNWPRVLSEVQLLVFSLRQAEYQISFDVQGLLKSAVWPWLAKIPQRYGFKATRESADRFYTHKLPPMIIRDTKTPAVERYLDFARAIGVSASKPEFIVPPVSEASRQRVFQWLQGTDASRPLIVLAPFTRWASKHWVSDYWAQLITELLTLPVRIMILGAPADQENAQQILRQLPEHANASAIINGVGKTDWPDLYALFQQTQLVIGLDSAPLHIADAVGVPQTIGLYGPTAPGRTGPVGSKNTTLSTALSCQPCFERNCPIKTHDCMQQLKPEVVAALVRQMLGQPVPDEQAASV